MYIVTEAVILIGLFLFSAWFSATESAFMSLSRMKIKKMIDNYPWKAKALKVWLENPNKYLTTLLVGNNAVNVMIASIATSVAVEICSLHDLSQTIAVSLAAVVVWIMLLLFGEIAPKIFSIRSPEKVVKFSVIPIYYFAKLTTPLSKILVFIVTSFIGKSGKKEIPILTHEDIKTTISVGHEIGVFGTETKKMMHSVLNFSQVTVQAIMTPRNKIEMVNFDTEREKFIDLIVETGHSRVPIYKDNSDNVIGIIYVRDLLDMWRGGSVFTVDDLLRPVVFVDEEKKVSELMRQFKKGSTHLVIAKNIEGKIVGLVTIEDIIEEVFGEILDEYDVAELFKE